MRARKISAAALVAVAAGLSLTACDSSGSDGASAKPTSPASTVATAPTGGGSGSSDSTGAPEADSSAADGQNAAADDDSQGGSGDDSAAAPGSDSHAAGGTTCQTAHLSFSTSFGMAEGEVLVNLTNTGTASCTMHGFPGVDLKGGSGTISAARSKLAAPVVTLPAGQATRFTLHFPPNNTGGSGVTFTSVIVTPPNETHSHTMPLTVNLPVSADPGPSVVVDPVGVGK